MKATSILALLLICATGLLAQATTARDLQTATPSAASGANNTRPTSWRNLLDSDSVTLGQVRRVFLDQRVVVGGSVYGSNGQNQLLEWQIAVKPEFTGNVVNPDLQKVLDSMPYAVPNALDLLPYTYSGKTAKVVAVQLHNSDEPRSRTNALGDAVSDDETINPYFDLVVKFDDGTIALTAQYPTTLAVGSVVELASVTYANAEQMRTELPGIVGKTVYAVGFSRLYQPDTTLDEISQQDVSKRILPAEIPFLKPLKIVAVKYLESTGVVIELELPNGKKALSLTSRIELDVPQGEGIKETFFEKAIGTLLPEIPSSLGKRDLDAIRSGTIYRGMSEQALEYAMGFPDKQNDWGSGGKQLIYGKSFTVYVNRQALVVDWQSLDEK